MSQLNLGLIPQVSVVHEVEDAVQLVHLVLDWCSCACQAWVATKECTRITRNEEIPSSNRNVSGNWKSSAWQSDPGVANDIANFLDSFGDQRAVVFDLLSFVYDHTWTLGSRRKALKSHNQSVTTITEKHLHTTYTVQHPRLHPYPFWHKGRSQPVTSHFPHGMMWYHPATSGWQNVIQAATEADHANVAEFVLVIAHHLVSGEENIIGLEEAGLCLQCCKAMVQSWLERNVKEKGVTYLVTPKSLQHPLASTIHWAPPCCSEWTALARGRRRLWGSAPTAGIRSASSAASLVELPPGMGASVRPPPWSCAPQRQRLGETKCLQLHAQSTSILTDKTKPPPVLYGHKVPCSIGFSKFQKASGENPPTKARMHIRNSPSCRAKRWWPAASFPVPCHRPAPHLGHSCSTMPTSGSQQAGMAARPFPRPCSGGNSREAQNSDGR